MRFSNWSSPWLCFWRWRKSLWEVGWAFATCPLQSNTSWKGFPSGFGQEVQASFATRKISAWGSFSHSNHQDSDLVFFLPSKFVLAHFAWPTTTTPSQREGDFECILEKLSTTTPMPSSLSTSLPRDPGNYKGNSAPNTRRRRAGASSCGTFCALLSFCFGTWVCEAKKEKILD